MGKIKLSLQIIANLLSTQQILKREKTWKTTSGAFHWLMCEMAVWRAYSSVTRGPDSIRERPQKQDIKSVIPKSHPLRIGSSDTQTLSKIHAHCIEGTGLQEISFNLLRLGKTFILPYLEHFLAEKWPFLYVKLGFWWTKIFAPLSHTKCFLIPGQPIFDPKCCRAGVSNSFSPGTTSASQLLSKGQM